MPTCGCSGTSPQGTSRILVSLVRSANPGVHAVGVLWTAARRALLLSCLDQQNNPRTRGTWRLQYRGGGVHAMMLLPAPTSCQVGLVAHRPDPSLWLEDDEVLADVPNTMSQTANGKKQV